MIISHSKSNGLLTVLILLFSFSLSANPTPEAGKVLFKDYCAQCHARDMKTAATGPALGGSEERWEDDEALYRWIRNSQKMIAEGHPRAVELWNEYKPTVMTAFDNLTDDEIASILLYVNCMYDGSCLPVAAVTNAGPAGEQETSNWPYYILTVILAFLALMMARIIGNLDQLAAGKEGRVVPRKSIIDILTSKGVIGFAIFALVIMGGYTTVNNATNLSRQQNYQPDQPIEFSHETHAGIHKIDCQYCHDGARRSKHSVIPDASTCMNCHRAIKNGSEYGTAELTKIFASVGYNPSDNTYIENYDSKSEDEIKEIYTKWIADEYVKEKGLSELDEDGEDVVAEQWDGIVSSLTNDQKTKIQGPIEWIRVHNLPDHVYFNHAQHVSVGKVDCEECHGKVEEMKVLQQAAPLSMGWCVNCHRQTEVKFTGNEYYSSYAKLHEELKDGKRDKVTVEDIGGLECQKCHY